MNGIRIPRPLGLTNLIKAYHIDPTESAKQRVNEHIVKSYVDNGFTWNYRKISIDELSIYTGIPTQTLLINITRAAKSLANLANPEQIQDSLQAMIGMIMRNGINDRGEIEEQLFKMKLSQGSSYSPFISSEVGKTIKLMLDSNKNLMDIVKTISPEKSTLIQINTNPNDEPIEEAKLVTTDNAIHMISANQEGLKDSQAMLNLVEEAELVDAPVVDARKQKGDHGDKERLWLKKLTSSEHLECINHKNRREDEHDIDPESDEI